MTVAPAAVSFAGGCSVALEGYTSLTNGPVLWTC